MSPDLAQSVLEGAPDAIFITDLFGNIEFANAQVSVLFGYERGEIIGQPIELLMPERFRQRHIGQRETSVYYPRVRPIGAEFEVLGRRRDGVEFPLELSLSPIEHHGGTHIAAAIRDVTERKKVEAELIAARRAAEAARAVADRANQGKSQFLAAASHDLRQPLQTLALLNGALCRMQIEPDIAEILAQQERTIDGMSRLLNALLDISKLESGAIKPDLTDCVVAVIFEELRAEFASIAASKGLELKIDMCDEHVHTDSSLLSEILRNLVSNAIKYTHQGWVELRCTHEASSVRLEVRDTGIGIAITELPRICDEFYRVDGSSTNSARDGYGLGLSIVQRMVKLLNLRFDVHSDMGRGSVFSLTLPIGTD